MAARFEVSKDRDDDAALNLRTPSGRVYKLSVADAEQLINQLSVTAHDIRTKNAEAGFVRVKKDGE